MKKETGGVQGYKSWFSLTRIMSAPSNVGGTCSFPLINSLSRSTRSSMP